MLLLPDGPFTDLLNGPAGALSIFGSSLINFHCLVRPDWL